MFANLLQLLTRRPSPGYEHGFVQEVRRPRRVPRNPRVEKFIFVCWLLIAAKCGLVVWLVQRYHVPVHPLWINGPTILFALLGTAVYFGRD
jgi:hypothetical protein